LAIALAECSSMAGQQRVDRLYPWLVASRSRLDRPALLAVARWLWTLPLIIAGPCCRLHGQSRSGEGPRSGRRRYLNLMAIAALVTRIPWPRGLAFFLGGGDATLPRPVPAGAAVLPEVISLRRCRRWHSATCIRLDGNPARYPLCVPFGQFLGFADLGFVAMGAPRLIRESRSLRSTLRRPASTRVESNMMNDSISRERSAGATPKSRSSYQRTEEIEVGIQESRIYTRPPGSERGVRATDRTAGRFFLFFVAGNRRRRARRESAPTRTQRRLRERRRARYVTSRKSTLGSTAEEGRSENIGRDHGSQTLWNGRCFRPQKEKKAPALGSRRWL